MKGFFFFASFTGALLFLGCSRAPVRSSDWVAALPDGEIKRKLIIGCTPCHPIGPPAALRKTAGEWEEVIRRMKKIDKDLDLALIPFENGELARWLEKNSRMPRGGASSKIAPAEIREYPAGRWEGFYHDMALAGGKAWIADYFGNKLYGVDPQTGKGEAYDIPLRLPPGTPAGAHAMDTTKDGALWITFTKGEKVARFDPKTKRFRIYSGFQKKGNVQYLVLDAERLVYEDKGGGIWLTHFSKEILSRLDPKTGKITVYPTKRTKTLPEKGVHLYAAVADSQGRLWYTETHGNRLGVLDPKTGISEEFDIFEAWSGPKRLAIDKEDRLWIPELAGGRITLYDTRERKVLDRLKIPIAGDYPYAIRRNPHTGDFWITGSGSDNLYRLDPKTKAFRIYRLPASGAYTRTVAFDAKGDVWTCYASYPNTHTRMSHRSGVIVRLTPSQ